MREEIANARLTGRSAQFWERTRQWLSSPEGVVVWVSLLGQTLLHLLLTLFMPLAYFSELNRHDGDSYYAIAYNPIPLTPLYSLMRYKRVFFALGARAAWPWDGHIGF